MKRMASWTIPHLMLLAVASCVSPTPELASPPTAEPSPPTTRSVDANRSPLPTNTETVRPPSSAPTSRLYLIEQVGDEYFREHYKPVHEEAVAAGLVKASYHYSYEPYVTGYLFTLFFDPQKPGLSDEDVSVVLLEPQAFGIGPEEAEVIALDNGLDATGGSYQVNLVLGPMTNNRFAWEVINPDAIPTAGGPEPIFRVVLDVEGGEVYATEVIKPMESHGSPS